MPFVKIQKNNVYSKRYQVKFRRRRIGKTDYYQRKRLILQRKNKYNTAKWRFVVRRTNQKIICQVVYSTIKGDKVKAQAESSELEKWGLYAGLTNYASAYCTGLLCARRLLSILDEENKKKDANIPSMSKTFDLVKEVSGEDVNLQELCEEKGIEQRPFTCYLDIGLARATKGNRVFSAMKGAIDGGINIPHSDKIFPSPSEEEDEKPQKNKKGNDNKKEKKGDNGEMLKERILGIHVQKWMDEYEKRDDKQEHQFSAWKKCLNDAGVKKVEDLYKKIHAEIRKNPKRENKNKDKPKYKRKDNDKSTVVGPNGEFKRDYKLTNAQRKERVKAKIKKFFEERNKE